MREILFKAKRADNGNWVFGNLQLFDNDTAYIKTRFTNQRFGCGYEVIPETVSQFTGKYDLKNQKAFEGDLFDDQNGKTWLITWSDATNSFHASRHENGMRDKPLGEIEICEVTGNIHDEKLK